MQRPTPTWARPCTPWAAATRSKNTSCEPCRSPHATRRHSVVSPGCAFEQKRYSEALDLFRILLEVDPDNATTHSDIGVTLYRLGQSEAALRSFRQALSLDPTLETARANLREIRKTLQQPVQ